MQTVPSLIGTGTAVAAAASGLVFGQTSDNNPSTTTRRVLHKRNHSTGTELIHNGFGHSLPSSRPGTSHVDISHMSEEPSASFRSRPKSRSRPPLSRYQRPHTSQTTPPKAAPSTTQALPNQPESPTTPSRENIRDSVSSSSSWMKRLSLRPLSQHGSSRRSSLIPDCQSATFSHGSAAPILRPSTAAPQQQLPPNKLVKRSATTTQQNAEPVGISRSKSKSHLPTLRRPATSHQRSATLQQLEYNASPILVDGERGEYRPSFDRLSRPDFGGATMVPLDTLQEKRGGQTTTGWLSFFHSKTTTNALAPSGGRYGDDVSQHRSVPSSNSKRIHVRLHSLQPAYLVKPGVFLVEAAEVAVLESQQPQQPQQPQSQKSEDGQMPSPSSPLYLQMPMPMPMQMQMQMQEREDGTQSSGMEDETLSSTAKTRIKRSLSSSFASAGNWVSKTSGSIRRPKRGAVQATSGAVRHVSTPVTGSEAPVGQGATAIGLTSPPIVGSKTGPLPLDSAALMQQTYHKRHHSSPLPPLSSPSSFPTDFSRPPAAAPTTPAGSSPSGGVLSLNTSRPLQPSGSSASSAAMSQLRTSHYHEKTASSVMEGSESDGRGFVSADEDDTDFKSDTLYDSLRTVASSRVRAVETPLESVYDESPPSTAGNTTRAKRLSIHEMLGRSWDEEDDKITEEDENSQTPIRPPRQTAMRDASSSRDLILQQSSKDMARMSLDDSDDDWARDDDDDDSDSDDHFNPLSPPSKGSSVNSRGLNPNVRLALANIRSSALNEASNLDVSSSDRPLSSLFDWSEQSMQDKHDAERRSGRPQTAYTKQPLDSRGGRSAIRKGPAPAHVRSQSVPVVHDPSGEAKPASSKYGTWGLGTKTVSEDWDEDFEFGAGGVDDGGGGEKDMEKSFSVPESIRASQLSVKAHSGQIRELSLLVNDLKRLCRHAREMNILNGPQHALWKEAEGVIALASPDEDLDGDDESQRPYTPAGAASDDTDHHQSAKDEVDNFISERADLNSQSLPPVLSKTAVVRERYSPQRRSVFSPDDDIFGGSVSGAEDVVSTTTTTTTNTHLTRNNNNIRPHTPDTRSDVNGVVRSVMEAMRGRTNASTVAEGTNGRKVQFDTNSLKALVRRSSELRDVLSDIVRKVDQLTESPIRPSRHDRGLDSSPAFTRVFDDPGSSPPRRAVRSRGNTLMENSSPENSPPRQIGRRFPLMTVR